MLLGSSFIDLPYLFDLHWQYYMEVEKPYMANLLEYLCDYQSKVCDWMADFWTLILYRNTCLCLWKDSEISNGIQLLALIFLAEIW